MDFEIFFVNGEIESSMIGGWIGCFVYSIGDGGDCWFIDGVDYVSIGVVV